MGERQKSRTTKALSTKSVVALARLMVTAEDQETFALAEATMLNVLMDRRRVLLDARLARLQEPPHGDA